MLKEYKAFLLRGNLLDLAVAFILGVAFNAIVMAFADGVIMETVASLVNVKNVEGLTLGPMKVGVFFAAVINFAIVATLLFLVIQAAKRIDRDDPEVTPAPTDETLLLTEIRDLLAAQQQSRP